MESLLKKITKILADLGESADDVFEKLDKEKVQGVRNTARFLNPIVRYCQKALAVRVQSIDLIKPGTLRITSTDGKKLESSLPLAVREFLEAFHHGVYPELEMPLKKVEDEFGFFSR